MIRKTLEVSISKEEIRTVDESGTKASTWVKIGQTIELEEGDIPDMCMRALRAEIQPEVDAWLLDQGGYIGPVGKDSPIDQTYSPHADIPEIGEGGLIELFDDTEIEISQVEDEGPNGPNLARRGQPQSPHDDIPELGEREILGVFQDIEIELSQVEDKPAAGADDDASNEVARRGQSPQGDEVDEIPL